MTNNFKEILLKKIERSELSIGVIGLGYVGLPLSLLFTDKNIKVIGFDSDLKKIEILEAGNSYINHIEGDLIKEARKKDFYPTSDLSLISDCDVIIVCVPTPLNKNREPDLSFINNTLTNIEPHLRKGQMIILESTTYPGTTDEIIGSFLSNKGFEVGANFFLAYSPEREDPGNSSYSTANIPKIVSGYSEACLLIASSIYKKISSSVYEVSSTRTAEMTKLLENIYRSVNIGLVNEMKILAHEMDINIFEVIDAAASKPFGFHAHYPGPGIGGHCIPIDPFYLTWKAREFGMNTKFIELAGEINQNMPNYVFSRLVSALNSKGLSLKGSRINILGLAYKKNVDDQRESPSVILMELIQRSGGIVSYSDPYIPEFKKMRSHDFNLVSEEINSKNLSSYDAVLLCTDHDDFNYDLIIKESKILIDTRGVFQREEFAKKKPKNLFTA